MIDAHAHLTDARFDGDRDEVVARAAAGGVERVLTCGEDLVSSAAAVALARRHHRVLRAAVGIHPHRAATCDGAAIDELRRLARHRLVVAIGEIGVDLSGRSAPLADQRRAIGMQLVLAAELDLPVVVHLRDAAAELRAALAGAPPVRGLLHCYSEGPGELAGWAAFGLVPSFAGTVTFARTPRLRDAAAAAPELLVETDAPYLAPEPHRGTRNEPALVAATYACVAGERGVTTEALADAVRLTAGALFGERWS